MTGDNQILPIINRRAPLLERLRENDNQDVGEDLGIIVGTSVKSDDEEKIEAMRDSIRTSLITALANNLGVEQENINDAYAEDLVDKMMDASEKDVLTEEAMDELGLKVSDEPDDDDDEEETDPAAELFE